MKTKTNKVPLVEPRGRKELLDKIEELEAQIVESAEALGIEGNTLPQILSGILELAQGGEKHNTLVINNPSDTSINAHDAEEYISELGISSDQLNDLFNGKYDRVRYVSSGGATYDLQWLFQVTTETNAIYLTYGLPDNPGDYSNYFIQFGSNEDGTYNAYLMGWS